MDILKLQLSPEEYNIIILRYGLDTDGVPFTPLGEPREYGKKLSYDQLGQIYDRNRRQMSYKVKKIEKRLKLESYKFEHLMAESS